MTLAESGMPQTIARRLRRDGLHEAVVKSYLVVTRTGALHERVAELARAHLAEERDAPHRGTWSDDPLHDYSALAAFLHPEDPGYLRELIAARQAGGWTSFAANRALPEPWIPWLALPGAAYERLAVLDELSELEHRRWCDALGLERVTEIDPESGSERRACGCPGPGRAVTWEALRDEYPFTVPGGCLRCERVPAGTRVVEVVTFDHGGTRYAVNGVAAGRHADIEPIWADNPEIEGTKISIGPLIGRGLALCR